MNNHQPSSNPASSSAETTEIAFILDRSGSMESCREAAILGFNEFLANQQQAKGRARLTLVLFDDQYLVPVQSIPVAEVVPLNLDTYTTGNSTALLDAIGRTVDELGARLAAMRDEDRPGQVIVCILTDGEENASRHFTWKQIAEKIEHQTEVYKWQFLFLGANQDAIATASNISIKAMNAAAWKADAPGSLASIRAFSRKSVGIRHMKMGIASAEENKDSIAPLSDIVHEEDANERGKGSPKKK